MSDTYIGQCDACDMPATRTWSETKLDGAANGFAHWKMAPIGKYCDEHHGFLVRTREYERKMYRLGHESLGKGLPSQGEND